MVDNIMEDDSKGSRRPKPPQEFYQAKGGVLKKDSVDHKEGSVEYQGGNDNTRKNYGKYRGRGQHFGNKDSNRSNEDQHLDHRGSNSQLDSKNSFKPNKPEQQIPPMFLSKPNQSSDEHILKDTHDKDTKNSSNYHYAETGSNSERMCPESFPKGRPRRYSGNRRHDDNNRERSDFRGNNDNRHLLDNRNVSPKRKPPDNHVNHNRGRDTRSMESSRPYHSNGGKPPLGHRNSAVDIESIPPRFRKKFLAENGHLHEDTQHQNTWEPNRIASGMNVFHNQQQYSNQQRQHWSQSLPTRGRGRLREDLERERLKHNAPNFMYSLESGGNSRSSTPHTVEMKSLDSIGISSNFDNNMLMKENSYTPKYEGSNNNHSTNEVADRLSTKIQENSPPSSHPNKLLELITQKKANAEHKPEQISWTDQSKIVDDMEKKLSLKSPTLLNPSPSTTLPTQDVRNLQLNEQPADLNNEKSSNRRNSERKKKSKKKKNSGGVQKRINANRSSSRGRNRRDNSKDGSRRSDYSPLSQDRSIDRGNSLSLSRDVTVEREIYRVVSDRPPSRNQWHYGQMSRENSRDRYSYSRASSGERAGTSSRNASRERSIHQDHYYSQRNHGGRSDSDGYRLPPPPPGARNSRNQGRDTWSGRNSRGASIDSGTGDGPHSPNRGGGGARRQGKRRKDSDQRHTHGAAPSSNWRDEMRPSVERNDDRRNSHTIDSNPRKGPVPGILILNQDIGLDRNRNMDSRRSMNNNSNSSTVNQKCLFDHKNPNKPQIINQSASSRARTMDYMPASQNSVNPETLTGSPAYYNVNSDNFKSSHNQDLIRNVERADIKLQLICRRNSIVDDWDEIISIRSFLQHSLQTFLTTDLKFCQAENVEYHFWRMLYYSLIEILRKGITLDETNKVHYVELINTIIKDGNSYFESILELLQATYSFKLDDYLNANYITPPKGLGMVGLALISTQKIYLFLGDLARYKELVNETSNYAKSKSWYTKAHQINPKNGRPYHQLALLAVYTRRKLDAVYYYMRSLMSSNPFVSARERLTALFDENRKKYEAHERKRLAERQRTAELKETKEKTGHGLRKEVWTRVGGGRTTTLLQTDKLAALAALSDEEELAAMSSVELNKRFIASYLHVHGKLISKIGMETFYECAAVMLRQFRGLLKHTPLAINCSRLLQLTALNIFAIESAHLKDVSSRYGTYRSEVQEKALAISLRMFGVLLEKCCSLLMMSPTTCNSSSTSDSQEDYSKKFAVHEDIHVILPAVKVWSDWMLCHGSVWNPPPTCDDFDVGNESDPWSKLAKLMKLLEPLDAQSDVLKSKPSEDYDPVRLPEDSQLAGFTPLMISLPETVYAPKCLEPELANLALRVKRLSFFGTVYLCGVEPPALVRHLAPDGSVEFVPVVRRTPPTEDPRRRTNSNGESDILEASMSEDESTTDLQEPQENFKDNDWAKCPDDDKNDDDTAKLLRRRDELQSRRRDLEKRKLRMQTLLKQGQVSVELEVRPRYLVPDTNCFIDHLPRLQKILNMDVNSPYTVVVPLVVVSELEGLQRAERLSNFAKAALQELRIKRPLLKFATTQGNLLSTATFTVEKDADVTQTNDDRILVTSLSLCKTPQPSTEEGSSDGVKRLVREVVLLTDDRNLRVKALARDLPVRDLPAFIKWAGLD